MDAAPFKPKDAKKFAHMPTVNTRHEPAKGGTNMQREMPLMGDVKRDAEVPPELVGRCRTARDALRLTVQWSGLKHGYIAERLGINPAQFSRILNGQAHLSEDLRNDLMDVCGNEAMLQWAVMSRGYQLVRDQRDQQIRELEEKLAALKGDEDRRQGDRRGAA